MDISIIGVPIYYGADKKGAEYGPDKLREKRLMYSLEEKHNVYDLGNIYVPEVKECDKFCSHANLKYLDAVEGVNKNIANAVYSTIKAESFPLILGGDHSVAIGSISGVSRAYKDIAVIWMDAHGDINTHATSKSANIHGMPLAAAMSVGYENLTNVYFEGQKVNPQNVFILGARDLDDGEIELIRELNLQVFTADEIKQKGISTVVQQVINTIKLRNIEAVHLSFDLDFIDAKYVPGTGTPVNLGINIEDTKKALRILAGSKIVKSMDFVELNPLLDKNDVTVNLAVDLISWTFDYM